MEVEVVTVGAVRKILVRQGMLMTMSSSMILQSIRIGGRYYRSQLVAMIIFGGERVRFGDGGGLVGDIKGV